MRSQTYIFLQKLKCPKCGRILAGGASHKIKADKWYFYYRCENCKNNIKETDIEESIKHILSDILEYDNVVNEFFLPMLKNKLDNNKPDYEKEIKNLEKKKDKVKYPMSYYAFNACWDLLDREIKADIVMRFIDNIELESKGKSYSVKQVDFRSTMYEDFKKLYELGYIDTKRKMTCEKDGVSIDTFVRYSEYLPAKQVLQNLYRLNTLYEVDLYKGTFYKDTCKLDFSPFFKKGDVPIRVFPLQKDTGKDLLSMGMLVTKENTLDVKVDNLRDLFECIPQEVKEDGF